MIDFIVLVSAVLLTLMFVVGATQLAGSLRHILDGVFWQRGGRIVSRREQPVRFWTTMGMLIIVSLFFVCESIFMALYVLLK